MRSRLVRLALVAVGVLGLAGMPVEPAKADTVGSAAFVAQIEVTGGIGYPVLTLPTPTVPSEQCLPLPPNSVLGIVEDTTDEAWNCHWVFDHPRGVTGGSIRCQGAFVNVLKNGLPPVSGPDCTFAVTGTVTGHCGLSGGQVRVVFDDGHNTYIFMLHFRGVGGNLVLSGHWTNDLGQHGKIYAEAVAAPVPAVPPVPPEESCTTKTQRQFIVSGAAELYTDPNL